MKEIMLEDSCRDNCDLNENSEYYIENQCFQI